MSSKCQHSVTASNLPFLVVAMFLSSVCYFIEIQIKDYFILYAYHLEAQMALCMFSLDEIVFINSFLFEAQN